MNIYIIGQNKFIDHATVRNAVEVYASLVLPTLHSKIQICIEFQTLPDYISGGVAPTEPRTKRPRSFFMMLNSSQSAKNTLITIAHEMVHVRQMALRQLIKYAQPYEHGWLGRRYVCKDIFMEDGNLPFWEIESYSAEKPLYKYFKKYGDKKWQQRISKNGSSKRLIRRPNSQSTKSPMMITMRHTKPTKQWKAAQTTK